MEQLFISIILMMFCVTGAILGFKIWQIEDDDPLMTSIVSIVLVSGSIMCSLLVINNYFKLGW